MVDDAVLDCVLVDISPDGAQVYYTAAGTIRAVELASGDVRHVR